MFSCLQTQHHSAAGGSRSHFDFQVLLRNTFCKAIMAIDSDDSDRSGERKLKIEKLEGFTILDTIKNIRGSLEEVKISTLIRIWKKLIPDPYG